MKPVQNNILIISKVKNNESFYHPHNVNSIKRFFKKGNYYGIKVNDVYIVKGFRQRSEW